MTLPTDKELEGLDTIESLKAEVLRLRELIGAVKAAMENDYPAPQETCEHGVLFHEDCRTCYDMERSAALSKSEGR